MDMANLMELQCESHDDANYKSVEFGITFVMISQSAKMSLDEEDIAVSLKRITIRFWIIQHRPLVIDKLSQLEFSYYYLN